MNSAPSLKILAVDDDRATLLLLSSRLTKEGYRVLTAANGEEAWAAARLERPDLVLSDMLLPKMDGISLCRKIKEDPALAATRVILATAVFKQAAFRAEVRMSGADEFVEKPFDMDVVLSRVRALIGRADV
ncbi:MAG TPA: response regulator [Acidobacteriota bacterium]|nr:response regulator [Acidobacteriota bacterium]